MERVEFINRRNNLIKVRDRSRERWFNGRLFIIKTIKKLSWNWTP